MGIMTNIHKKIITTAQNNLLYIVSSYFSQEKYQNTKFNQFIMCQPDEEKKEKIIENYPVLSFKYDEPHIKYIKYEYRQIIVLQMIMMTPRIFIVLTEEEIILWNDSLKISFAYFEKFRKNKTVEIMNKNLTKFDDDLFWLSYEIDSKKENKSEKDTTGLQFVLYSAKKIINEGKITELFFINKINHIFPINKNQVFIIINKKIQIMDISTKKVVKTDNNLEYIIFPISYAKYLFNDLFLLSSKDKNRAIIYNVENKSLLYFIEDYIQSCFNLGLNKVIVLGQKIKEILILPDMYVLSLEQYETDIFNSLEYKSFYTIDDTRFLFINYKTQKLKEVFINELNELIITKEITCPNEFVNFCPFVYTYENYTRLLCSLFICRDQMYQIFNHELINLIEGDENEQTFSSIKRLFLNFFVIDKNKFNHFNNFFGNNSLEKKNNKIDKNNSIAYVPYSVISTKGNSTLNFALYRNKKFYELNSFCNLFEPNLKSEIIFSKNSNDIYIISLIKNIFIYIIKINGVDSSDVNIKHNFGNIKTKGLINLGNDLVFIFYDKKATIINIKETFKTSKIIPLDNYSFTFNIIYAFLYLTNIIILSEDKLYLYNTSEKKITKEIKLNFKIIVDDNIENIDINILKLEDNIYILIIGKKFMLFNIENFEKIEINENLKIKQRNLLFFISYKEKFEIIKKDIITNKILKTFSEKTDEQKHKMKYLSSNSIFVGTYPNKFFIFENNDGDNNAEK